MKEKVFEVRVEINQIPVTFEISLFKTPDSYERTLKEEVTEIVLLDPDAVEKYGETFSIELKRYKLLRKE